MNKWAKSTLGEILPLKYGKNLPAPQRMPGGVPVYSSAGQIGYHVTPLVSSPCIVIGRKGSVGTVYYEKRNCFPIDTTFYTTGSSKIDLKFGYYALLHADLAQYSQDSAVPGLNRARYSEISISVPPIQEQEAISDVLGAFDDKIAANTKLAATSSQLAQSVFAAATGTQGLKVALSESSHLLSRGITPKYSDGEDTMIVLNQKCVRDQRVNLAPARRTDLSKVREEKILSQNDVLVNSTGQGTLGRVARWTHAEQVTVDSHITIIRFNSEEVDPVCAGFAVLRSERQITDMAEGSTGQTELSRVELGKLKILLPPREQQQELGQRLAKMGALENAYLQENERLAAMRDALLPQLMSGKLRVKDAEPALEDVL